MSRRAVRQLQQLLTEQEQHQQQSSHPLQPIYERRNNNKQRQRRTSSINGNTNGFISSSIHANKSISSNATRNTSYCSNKCSTIRCNSFFLLLVMIGLFAAASIISLYKSNSIHNVEMDEARRHRAADTVFDALFEQGGSIFKFKNGSRRVNKVQSANADAFQKGRMQIKQQLSSVEESSSDSLPIANTIISNEDLLEHQKHSNTNLRHHNQHQHHNQHPQQEVDRHELSIQPSTMQHLQTLSNFPKIIHFIWPDKSILNQEYEIIQHGAKRLQTLNPDWKFIIHDYQDIDTTIQNFYHPSIPPSMNIDLKNAHIVEKTDAFRLIIIYTMGGLYVDIDRVMNVDLTKVLDMNQVKMVVATYYDINFTNDLFGSSPQNELILNAFKRQCEKRLGYPRLKKQGWIKSSDQMQLVRTYTASMEEDLFGRLLIIRGNDNNNDDESLWDKARHVLTSHSNGMIVTYKDVWCDGLPVNEYDGCKEVSRASLYDAYNVTRWVDEVDGA